MSSSVLHMYMSEKTTDMGPPIGHLSICLIKLSLVENTDSFVNFIDKFLNMDFVHKGFNSLLVYMVSGFTQSSQQLEYWCKVILHYKKHLNK